MGILIKLKHRNENFNNTNLTILKKGSNPSTRRQLGRVKHNSTDRRPKRHKRRRHDRRRPLDALPTKMAAIRRRNKPLPKILITLLLNSALPQQTRLGTLHRSRNLEFSANPNTLHYTTSYGTHTRLATSRVRSRMRRCAYLNLLQALDSHTRLLGHVHASAAAATESAEAFRAQTAPRFDSIHRHVLLLALLLGAHH